MYILDCLLNHQRQVSVIKCNQIKTTRNIHKQRVLGYSYYILLFNLAHKVRNIEYYICALECELNNFKLLEHNTMSLLGKMILTTIGLGEVSD